MMGLARRAGATQNGRMTLDPRLNLRLHFTQGLTFGRGKADLLQAIDDEGSISAAGRRMGMSYRRAWNLVEEMNLAFIEPLIDSARGGSGGGGAALTEKGRQILAHYRALEDLLRTAGAPFLDDMRLSLAEGNITQTTAEVDGK